jgi:hypothetical protein
VRFESFETTASDLSYDCSDDARHQMKLYDSGGGEVIIGSYQLGLNSYCAGFALGLDAGTYYVEFSHIQGTENLPPYRLEADFLDDVGSETEPNDTLAQATPVASSSFVVHGALSSATDIDYYAITVPAGFSVRAQTLPATANATLCDTTTDTILWLENSQGIELAYDDDWYTGIGCSWFDGTGANHRSGIFSNAWNYTATTQTYYVGVKPYAGAFGYRLVVTVRP